MLKESNLHNYQKVALNIILKKKKCALFLDMGMGKTIITLTAISKMLDDFFINKTLIIAPLRVANSVWTNEAKKWEHLQHLKIKVCTGTQKERLSAINSDSDIYIINRENIPWLIQNCKWKWDSVIIDESSSFKNQASKRFRALKKITKYLKNIVLLSGTPSPNGEMDLWSQLYLIDNGERLGRTITSYRRKYFNQDYMHFKYTIIESCSDIIKKLIKDVCITMSSEDYLDLPEIISLMEYIEIPEKIKKIYKSFKKDFVLSLEHKDIEAVSSAVLSNKLLQICNGAIYDKDKNTHELHDLKLIALKEIIEDNPNENFLIAYNFKSDLRRILKTIPTAIKLETKEQEDEWNKGNIKILVAHPMSAGHGLNLQFGGNIIVWFGLNWSLELYQQFNKRLHRQGQKKPVRIIHIVAKGYLDDKIILALNNKAETQQDLINYLKVNI